MELHFPAELMETLTEEQVKQLQSQQIELKKDMIALRSQVQIKKLEMQQLWLAPELDEEAISQKGSEIAQLQAQKHEKMIRHHLEVAKTLTQEQRTLLMKSKHRGAGRYRDKASHRDHRGPRPEERRHHKRGHDHDEKHRRDSGDRPE
jgi:Spy/CpxP family protein refolding chaperone